MPDEGAARGPPAAGLLPRQRLGHPYVQQHQVQFAPLPSGASGQPPAHPRPATAIVDEQRLAGAYRHTQPPEVLPPRPRAVHRIRQPGRHHRLAGEMHGARVGNGRGLGPTSQQGALAAPRQSGDHHHRPRWIRQQGRHVSRAPQIHQSARPQRQPPCGSTDFSVAPGQTELPTTRPLASLVLPHLLRRAIFTHGSRTTKPGRFVPVAAGPPWRCRRPGPPARLLSS